MTSLFFNQDQIDAIRQRVKRHEWAQNALDKIRYGLESHRKELLTGIIPDGQGAGTLVLHLAICGRLLDGWYHEAARTIISTADDPASFEFKQTHDICMALDFLKLDEKLRNEFYAKILLPLAEKLLKRQFGGSNIQTTYNLSLLCIGLLAERRDLIELVTSDPERGLPYQLANSVYPDGFWYEQCHASYHCGSIERFLRIKWIADHNSIPFAGDDVIKRMIDTLPGMALPGGVLPLIGEVAGDGSPTIHKDWLEIAYTMYKIPWVGWALKQMERESLWSLLFGSDIGAMEAPKPDSRLFPDTGLCVLKNDTSKTYWQGKGSGVTVTFGAHGDWHGHAGKLGIEYRHNGQYLIRDHGHSDTYNEPIYRLWYITTLAHSTAVLDKHNQAFTWTNKRPELEHREAGMCHAHLFRADVSACTVSADFAFPGCSLKRTLFLTSNYLLDIMECDSLDGKDHTFDWVMHTGGRLHSDLPFSHDTLECFNKGVITSPPDRSYSPGALMASSYDYIREVESLRTADDWSIDVMNCKWADDVWQTTDKAMRLTMLGQEGTTVFKGVCPAAARNIYDPVILVRRHTQKTVFIALHVPEDQLFDLECPTNENGTIVCRVSNDIRSDLLLKQNEPRALNIDGRTLNGTLDFFTSHSSPT